MSFDIIQEISKKYNITTSLDKTSNIVVNERSRNIEQDIEDIKHNTKRISATPAKFISDYVCASYYDKNIHGEISEELFYIYKYNGSYTYSKTKPFEYVYIAYNKFLESITNTAIENTDREILRKSVKLKKLSRRSSGVYPASNELYYMFDSPYGGLVEGSCYLFIELDGYTKPIDRLLKIGDNDAVIIDHLEGKVYIHNQYPDVVRNLYMYTDVAPVVIYQNGSYSPVDKEEVFGIFEQKGMEGLIDIFKINEKEYIITFSFDAFIASSDPYFIEVDGITLLSPRSVPKKTPIYVKQSFTHKVESFLDDYYNLFLSKEPTIEDKSGTHVRTDFIEDTGDLVSGLFVYEQEAPFILNTKPNYIPLFKKQDFIREENNG